MHNGYLTSNKHVITFYGWWQDGDVSLKTNNTILNVKVIVISPQYKSCSTTTEM